MSTSMSISKYPIDYPILPINTLPFPGMAVMNANFRQAIIEDNSLFDWFALYGMCHAICLLSNSVEEMKHYAELRQHFFEKAMSEYK